MFWEKNRAKCLTCGDILTSTDNTWTECSCGSLKIRGGSKFLEREGSTFKELSVVGVTEEDKKTIIEDRGPTPPNLPFT